MNSFQLYLFLKKMSVLLNGTISRAYENLIVSLRTDDCSDEEDQMEEENAKNETNDEWCYECTAKQNVDGCVAENVKNAYVLIA